MRTGALARIRRAAVLFTDLCDHAIADALNERGTMLSA
jgi:hypothetical protein